VTLRLAARGSPGFCAHGGSYEPLRRHLVTIAAEMEEAATLMMATGTKAGIEAASAALFGYPNTDEMKAVDEKEEAEAYRRMTGIDPTNPDDVKSVEDKMKEIKRKRQEKAAMQEAAKSAKPRPNTKATFQRKKKR